MKVVFDTVIFVRALINPHSRWGPAVFDRADAYQLIVSQPIVREYLDVLHRPQITSKFRSLEGAAGNSLLLQVLTLFEQAETVDLPEITAVSRDPKDDKFLATAQVAGAEYLISEDADLLDLSEHHGTRIVDAAAFLHLLDQDRRPG